MKIRVLFADDQIPWDNPDRDDQVKKAIEDEKGNELRALGKDPIIAYEEDKQWFNKLLHHLEFDFGFEITAEREFSKATLRVGKQSEFDIAVIDLSWSGDSALPRGKRSNVGLKLIDMLDTGKSSVPVIAFSQNFRDDRALMLQVTRRNAFPMQKYYSDIDYHALGSAILYLTRHLRRDKSERAENHVGSTFWDVVRLIPRMYLLIVVVLILCIVAGLAHINTTPGEPVKVFGIEVYNKAPSK